MTLKELGTQGVYIVDMLFGFVVRLNIIIGTLLIKKYLIKNIYIQ